MKRCPTCNRTFDDETLSFCLDDGTPLVRDAGGRADSQETLVSPSPTGNILPSTQIYGHLSGKATINASQFNPPPAHVFAPPPKQRRTWPWVVGILAIVLVVIGGIVIAAVVIPPLMLDSRNQNRAQDETASGTEVYEFTDTFVWRDHRWQAVASKNTRVK